MVFDITAFIQYFFKSMPQRGKTLINGHATFFALFVCKSTPVCFECKLAEITSYGDEGFHRFQKSMLYH